MLIDWFTVAAQVVNFLVLVWLLKRFLYHPILDAIDAREKRIADELARADAGQTEAQQARDDFQRKREDFEQQRAELLRRATVDADAERQRLLEAAHQAADEASNGRRESVRAEARRLHHALVQRTQQEVFEIARKTLADLADARLEAQMVMVLARRLRDLNAADKVALQAVFTEAPGPLNVRSTFALCAAERATLTTAIEENLGMTPALHFETEPALIGGIEIATVGQRLSWSIKDYLAALQAGVDQLLEGKAQPVVPKGDDAHTPPKPRIHAH